MVSACATPAPSTAPLPVPAAFEHSLIPLPSTVQLDPARSFVIDTLTSVFVEEGAAAVDGVAAYLVTMLSPVVRPQVQRVAAGGSPASKGIRLRLDQANASAGEEGYDLTIAPEMVTIVARTPAGLFHGIQTVRQLLPASVEHRAALGRKLILPAGHIADVPRFEWRGLMLDVSRHFLGPRDVKRFVDLMALYKLNRLHLHLSDDQGWRIEIKSRPSLTAVGGSTQVGGGPGGFYTQDEYRDIVSYAASRFITVVPEIDMPGHTNAALASIPELNCNKVATPLYTGIKVGFSALCVDSAVIYPVIEDIVREISSLTPGAYFHIGGDEVHTMQHDKYLRFIERMQGIVNSNGKRMIGWGEISPAQLSTGTIVQNWKRDSSAVHAARGGKVILSPSAKVYIDQQYDSTTILGLHWAGYSSLENSYNWEPATVIPGVGESSVLGVEGPLWAETIVTVEDYEYMAFPRLIAIAEIGWSPAAARQWNGFQRRLEIQSARLNALGVNTPRR